MFRRLTLGLSLAVLGSPAFAHLDPVAHGSFAAGFTHPVFGTDHVIAMLAVGLWAAMIGGRALFALPGAFVGAMLAGFALSLGGVAIPMVEPVILASVIAFGAAAALALRVDLWVAVGAVALFGLAHGNAHGSELGVAGALPFAAGFVVATAALHAAGAGIGLALARLPMAARALGGAAALAGVALAIA